MLADEVTPRCSFCKKSQMESGASKFIASDSRDAVFICFNCVKIAYEKLVLPSYTVLEALNNIAELIREIVREDAE